jgi:hypothetical protein
MDESPTINAIHKKFDEALQAGNKAHKHKWPQVQC